MKRDPAPHWENGERGKSLQFVEDLKSARLNAGPDRAEELIFEFNHNVINLYFTVTKSTMYTGYYDKVYELLWQSFHLFA